MIFQACNICSKKQSLGQYFFYIDLAIKKTSSTLQLLYAIDTILYQVLIDLFRSAFAHSRTGPSPCLTSLKMVYQISCSLNASIGKLAYLFAVESVPSAAVELAVELSDEFGVNEVDKSVSDIAGIEVIDWQIKEVDFEFVVPAYLLKKHFLSVLVGNVSDHERCPSISFDLNIMRCTLSGIILYS